MLFDCCRHSLVGLSLVRFISLARTRCYCSRRLPESAAALLSRERRAAFVQRVGRRPRALPVGAGPAAAVLVPMCCVRGRLGLLYTVRSMALTSHAGEVAFPGGLRDPADTDLLHTAIRETREELGLEVTRDQVWSPLPDIPSSSRGNLVRPFLADVGAVRPERLQIESREVHHVFFLPLEFLCDPRNVGSTQFRQPMAYAMPLYVNGPRRIWGLTAIVTHLVLSNLLPDVYVVKPRFVKPFAIT